MPITIKLMQKMLNIKGLIKTEDQYEDACGRIYDLMQTELVEGSAEADAFQLLTLLVDEYQRTHHPILPPHPIDAIRFRLEQMGLDESELSTLLGSRSNHPAAEILSGKRKLSLPMIRKIHEKLNISAETLIATY